MKTVLRIVKALCAVVIGLFVTVFVGGDPVEADGWLVKVLTLALVALVLKKIGAFDEPKDDAQYGRTGNTDINE